MQMIVNIVNNMALVYMIIVCCTFFLFIISATSTFGKYKKTKKFLRSFEDKTTENFIPVSILVPAYNEEVTICSTIRSLTTQKYTQYEIVIIADGCKDDTVKVILDEYDLKPKYKPMNKALKTKEVVMVYSGKVDGVEVLLIDKVNGGKADALNVGINYSKYPVFVAVDADSILQDDAIKNVMKPFMENEKTVASGGNVKISNHLKIEDKKIMGVEKPKGILVPLQIVEYLRAFLISRVAWDNLNMNLIVSGAFGAFNKKVVLELDGYKANTIGEDMELIMRMHKHFIKKKEEYYISFVADANCYTQAPDTFAGLKAQRRRWQTGLIDSMITHKGMTINSKWFLAKCYFIFFELITPIVELGGLLILVFSILFGMVNFKFLLGYYLVLFIYALGVSSAALMLEAYIFDKMITKSLMLKLILVMPIESFGYRQILNFYRITSFIGYKKNKHQWGTITRKKQSGTS